MALDTFSKFYYINQSIDQSNQNINFDEGGGSLLAQVAVGSYTISELALAIKTAMDASGTLDYTVTLDRDNRLFTISSTAPFDLLVATGAQAGSSIFPVIGFTVSDRTGFSSYVGNEPSGVEYNPQFILQSYIAPGFHQERIQPTVNEAASGVIEVVSFGVRQFISMDLMFITNNPMDGKVIKNNINGIQDALDFMEFATTKAPLEFMPDENNSSLFYKVFLDKTPTDGDGLGFVLSEETGNNLRDIYKIGRLRWRII